jgi:hypothetical protein
MSAIYIGRSRAYNTPQPTENNIDCLNSCLMATDMTTCVIHSRPINGVTESTMITFLGKPDKDIEVNI